MQADFAWALRIAASCNVSAGITYFVTDGFELKLDVYRPFEEGKPRPTLMFMHGGGWAEGSTKETWALWFLPFLQLGWVVVNVDYRHSGMANAPAAVEDCLQALRWIGRNARQHRIDTQQLVIAGLSAGGHLALLTGMVPLCMSVPKPAWAETPADLPKPVAIVNWCGPTDLTDLVASPNRQGFAVHWLGDRPDQLAVARAVSPLTYICADLPPVITLHGDRDDIVPYHHAVRLHEALSKAAVSNQLVTLPGAVHASLDAYLNAYPQILDFLAQAGVTVHPQ